MRLEGRLDRGILRTDHGDWKLRCEGVDVGRLGATAATLVIFTARGPNFSDFVLRGDSGTLVSGITIPTAGTSPVGKIGIGRKAGRSRTEECFDATELTVTIEKDGRMTHLRPREHRLLDGYDVEVRWCERRTNIRCSDVDQQPCYAVVTAKR